MRREDSAGEATLRGGCRMCSMGRSTCTVQVSLTRATTIPLLCFQISREQETFSC